jgi:hypothetical protein
MFAADATIPPTQYVQGLSMEGSWLLPHYFPRRSVGHGEEYTAHLVGSYREVEYVGSHLGAKTTLGLIRPNGSAKNYFEYLSRIHAT